MATVNFDDSNEDRIPAAHRAEYQKVIKSLIDELRPVAETGRLRADHPPASESLQMTTTRALLTLCDCRAAT